MTGDPDMSKSKPEQQSDVATSPSQASPLFVNTQYVKDLSFENPSAPASLVGGQKISPKVDVSVDVSARRMQEKLFEVVLRIRVNASHDDNVLFLAEVDYAGVFTVGDIPEEEIEPEVLIHAPQLLFPFARAIIADNVRDGGFAPLLVQPIDFAVLYNQRKEQQKANGQGSKEEKNGHEEGGNTIT